METQRRDARRYRLCRGRRDSFIGSQSRFFVFAFCFLILNLFFFPTADYLLAHSFGGTSASYLAGQEDAFQKGLIALKENRLEASLEELTTAEHEHPDDARVHTFRGIVLARLGQSAQAAAEYREAIRLDPRMEDAYRNLGFLEWTGHQIESAREALERAVELTPEDSFAHYYLGRVQLDAGLYAQGFEELDSSRIPWPPDAGFLIEAATGYIALRRQEEARKVLDQLRTLPLSDAQSMQFGSLLLAVHENDTAINLFRKLSDRKPADPAHWAQFDLALVYLLTGSYEKAADQAHASIDVLRRAGSEPAEAAPAWSLIGIAYARLGHSEQATNAFRQAATLTPGQEEPWLNLTRELMELSHYADAISAVQEGLAANPKSYALRLRLGAANLSAGRYPEAENVFRDLVTAGDPLPTGYIGLAQVLLRTGRAEEAASELAAARQKLGPNFLISYFRGLALGRAGKQLEAMSAFEEAVRLDPHSAEAHLSLGKTELALGRVSDAIAELEEVLRLSPGNMQARRLLSQAYRRAGDAKSAAKFSKAVAHTPAAVEGDLLGDFLLPEWQGPPEHEEQ
jgi:tetratricopeptide (TPR) repeat protein